jgi:protein SCO1/2
MKCCEVLSVKPAILRSLIAIVMSILAVAAVFALRGEVFRPKMGGDFTLQSAEGPVSLEQFRGKIVLIYFGYTFCPDACPTSLSSLSHAFRLLTPEQLAQVQGIFISVDPERDTLARLKDYTAYFHPQIVGITGDPKELTRIAARYGVSFHKQDVKSAAGYLVDHTSMISLVERDGSLAFQFPHGTSGEEIARDLQQRLSGSVPPK